MLKWLFFWPICLISQKIRLFFLFPQILVKISFNIHLHTKLHTFPRIKVFFSNFKTANLSTSTVFINAYILLILYKQKARDLIESRIRKALEEQNTVRFNSYQAKMSCSTSGPATTLHVEWRGEKLDIDIVVCLQSSDVISR